MRLMLHIFKKDFRRLWPVAAALWAMLAALAALQFKLNAGSTAIEASLYFLTVAAWVALAGLAVLEEPLVGDRNFWTTRPHHWPPLLASKLLFVALAIHIPAFIAYMIALSVAGYPPAQSIGPLLWKQIVFFGVITLPSMAIATLVGGFSQFVLVGLGSLGAAIFITSTVVNKLLSVNGSPRYQVRGILLGTFIALVALAAIRTQYARRRANAARVVMISGALATVPLVALLPARAEYAIPGQAAQAAPRITLRNGPFDESVQRRIGTWPMVALPIEIAAREQFHIKAVTVDAGDPGAVFHSGQTFGHAPDIYADTSSGPSGRWLVLRFSRAAWERLKSGRVHMRGRLALEYYRPGHTTTIPARGRHFVSDLGWCATEPQLDNFSGTATALRLVCQSLRDRPLASVTVLCDEATPELQQRLDSSFFRRLDSPIFRLRMGESVFSPLDGGSSYFQILTPDRRTYPGAREFMIPEASVPSARFEITPEIPTGRAMVDFDLGEVSLSDWRLAEKRIPPSGAQDVNIAVQNERSR